MVFESVYQFREAVTKYVIERGVQIDKYINDKTRVRVKCKLPNCPWILYGSKETNSDNFVVKIYNPRHKCHKTNLNPMCNSKFLAKFYKEKIINLTGIKGWELQDFVRKELGLYVGKGICLKAKRMVLKEQMGDHIKEFSRICDYRDILLQTNPGSTCVVKTTDSEDGKKLFEAFYICFGALKKSFIEGCRPCIGLDGCFLKGICKGQLLVAIAKDANNQMFPVACAVIGNETKETWRWFVRILKSDLNITDEGAGLTIISDMQKGLYAAVQEFFPDSEHRMCARHILSNWAKDWRGVERRMTFWMCARATFEAEFKKSLKKLAKLGGTKGDKIVEDLINYDKEAWCKTYFRYTPYCDNVDKNMAESFNAWILGPRQKTIITMLEEIRTKVMNRFAKTKTFAETWYEGVSPMAMMVFNANVERSMDCSLLWNGDVGYEVSDGPYVHVVDMEAFHCSCRSWGLKGIPCAHAIATMHHLHMDPIHHISHWVKKETYLKSYSNYLQPVPNMAMWPESTNEKVEPPSVRQMPGRPKKNRRKEVGETKTHVKLSKRGIAMSCSICKSKDHNKRCCPNRPQGTQQGSAAQSQASTSRGSNSGRGRGRGRGKSSSSSRDGGANTEGNGAIIQSSAGAITQGGGASTQVSGAGASSQVSGPSTQVSGPSSQVSGPSTQGSSAAVKGKGRKVQHIQVSSDSCRGAFKKPRIVGHGVFVSKSGYTYAEQGRSVSRVIASGSTKKQVNSSVITGDIGFKPSKGLKWKGKQAISTRQLQERSALLQYQKNAQASQNSTKEL